MSAQLLRTTVTKVVEVKEEEVTGVRLDLTLEEAAYLHAIMGNGCSNSRDVSHNGCTIFNKLNILGFDLAPGGNVWKAHNLFDLDRLKEYVDRQVSKLKGIK